MKYSSTTVVFQVLLFLCTSLISATMANASIDRMEEMFDQLKITMDNNKKEINANTRALIEGLSSQLQEVRIKQEQLEQRIEKLEWICQEQADKNQTREDRDRRDNLVFFGIKKQPKERWHDIEIQLIQFLKEYFDIQLNHYDFVRAHRVGRGPNSPIIARFFHFKVKDDILSKARSVLKDTPFAIFEDFSVATRSERKLLFQEANRVRRETEGRTRCQVSYRTLRIDGVPHMVKDGKVVKIKDAVHQNPSASDNEIRGSKQKRPAQFSPSSLEKDGKEKCIRTNSTSSNLINNMNMSDDDGDDPVVISPILETRGCSRRRSTHLN